ncbi:DNA-binding transcriptional LysR family regulator [Bradyrhizobium sp. USDA 4506]
MTTLDVDAVRTFVTIADLKSFTRAAETLGTTQGAISVKLKRLESQLGHRLIERTPRLVRLSAQGAAFLAPAQELLAAHDRAVAALSPVRPRRFSLGIATHVGGAEVPTLLTRLHAHDPALTIEVRLEDSRDLLDAFDRGEIDAAIIRREDDRRDGEMLATDHYGWFATPDFVHRAGEPLRLAASSPSCGVLNIATRALAAANIPWTESFLGCGSFCCRRCGRRRPRYVGVLPPARPGRDDRGQPAARPACPAAVRDHAAVGAVRCKITRGPEDDRWCLSRASSDACESRGRGHPYRHGSCRLLNGLRAGRLVC